MKNSRSCSSHVARVRRPAAERLAVGVERGGEAAEVGDVLGERQLAVDREAGQRLVRRELIDQRLRERLKALHVLGRPPVPHPVLGVVVGAQHVDVVRDVVSDERPDGTVGRGVG